MTKERRNPMFYKVEKSEFINTYQIVKISLSMVDMWVADITFADGSQLTLQSDKAEKFMKKVLGIDPVSYYLT